MTTTTGNTVTYWEDLTVGQQFSAGPVTMTAEDIIAFARQYDPQDFHTDVEKAKDTPFGELVASGWHTAAVTMRMILQSMPDMPGGMIGRRVERMNWPRPVRPGDSLTLHGEITGLKSRDGMNDRAIMMVKNTTRNQKGEIVLDMETLVFVPRRPA